MLKHSLFALGVLLLAGVAQPSAQRPAGGGGQRAGGAPPGAPIGDGGQDWLSRPRWW
jgi:hypothetical protein